jgi:hypothetical protein
VQQAKKKNSTQIPALRSTREGKTSGPRVGERVRSARWPREREQKCGTNLQRQSETSNSQTETENGRENRTGKWPRHVRAGTAEPRGSTTGKSAGENVADTCATENEIWQKTEREGKSQRREKTGANPDTGTRRRTKKIQREIKTEKRPASGERENQRGRETDEARSLEPGAATPRPELGGILETVRRQRSETSNLHTEDKTEKS